MKRRIIALTLALTTALLPTAFAQTQGLPAVPANPSGSAVAPVSGGGAVPAAGGLAAPVSAPPVNTDLGAPISPSTDPAKTDVTKPEGAKPAPKKATKPAGKKPTGTPFTGKLESVDKAAMTLTIAGKEKSRVIHVTSKTRFLRDGKPAIYTDAAVGEEIAGSAKKAKDGSLEAVSVRFGAKPAKPAKAATPKKAAKHPKKAKTPTEPATGAPAPGIITDPAPTIPPATNPVSQ